MKKILVIENLSGGGIGDFPTRFNQALMGSLSLCKIEAQSISLGAVNALSLDQGNPRAAAVKQSIDRFQPETLIEIVRTRSSGYGDLDKANSIDVRVIVKDQTTTAIIRDFTLYNMGRNLSGNFGSIKGSLRWQILHRMHRDAILNCDPGPTDGDRIDFGL
jgi:hypothetical protein